eukprot:2265941-Lingulodinium_polyedra.AAC.1
MGNSPAGLANTAGSDGERASKRSRLVPSSRKQGDRTFLSALAHTRARKGGGSGGPACRAAC